MATTCSVSTVDKDCKGDGPTFGMQKGMRIQPGQIFYKGKYIDQTQFYQVLSAFIDFKLTTAYVFEHSISITISGVNVQRFENLKAPLRYTIS